MSFIEDLFSGKDVNHCKKCGKEFETIEDMTNHKCGVSK